MKNSLSLVLLLLLMSCSKNESNPANGSGGSPTVDNSTVDNVNATNGDVSAAIDGNDKIHVAYFSFNRGLKYATNKTGPWVATMIHPEDTTTSTGYFNDIAVDNSGFVHIVYVTDGVTMNDTSAIYYATNKSGVWVKTKIAHAIGSGFSGAGIAVTSLGKVHIVYGNSSWDLCYTNDLSGVWSGHVRIGSYWTNVRPRLALDANNNVYAAYEHGGEGSLHLQTINSSGDLVFNSILDGGNLGDARGWNPDIAINKTNGSVLISYWNYDSNLLKLYNAGTITTMDTLTNGTNPAVVTDDNGKAYVCYTDLSTDELYLVTNRTGSWASEKLPVSIVGSYSAVVVESTGKIDIIYNVLGASLKVISK
ncbi:MAG: hypothetical protein WC674_10895 [Candidatus Krumholzibacteriia bacterium]